MVNMIQFANPTAVLSGLEFILLSITNVPSFLIQGQTYIFNIHFSGIGWAIGSRFSIRDSIAGEIGSNRETYVGDSGNLTITTVIPNNAIDNINIFLEYYNVIGTKLSSNGPYTIPMAKYRCTSAHSGICEAGFGASYVHSTKSICEASDSCKIVITPTKYKCSGINTGICALASDGTYDSKSVCEAASGCAPVVTTKWKCTGANTGDCTSGTNTSYTFPDKASCIASSGCAIVTPTKWKCTDSVNHICSLTNDGTFSDKVTCEAAISCGGTTPDPTGDNSMMIIVIIAVVGIIAYFYMKK